MRISRMMLVGLALLGLVSSLSVILGQTKKDSGRVQMEMGRPDGPPPPRPGAFDRHMFEQLNLSDEQKAQIKTLMDSARTASEQYREQLKESHEAMKSIVEASTFNEEQARQALAAKAAAETELEIIQLRTHAAIYKLLTAEQKAQLDKAEKSRPDFPRGEGFRPPPPPQKR